MFKIKQDLSNKLIYVKINKIKSNMKNGIRKAFYYIGRDVIYTASQGIINPPKTGRVYLKRLPGRKRKKLHQSSAPGEYPAQFSGALRRSLNFKVHGFKQMRVGSASKSSTGENVYYGRALELGFLPHNLAPRPFLSNSIKKREGNAVKYFYGQVNKLLK